MADNIISAKDCEFFESKKKSDNIKELFDFTASFSKDHVFSFSNKTKDKTIDYKDAPFATFEYDSEINKINWRAGRWVGENKDKNRTILVEPRFGNIILFIMLEEIFSINILNDSKKVSNSNSLNSLLENIIPLIWERQLGNANRYGFPRNNNKIYYKGSKIKGNIDIRKSIIPFFKDNKIVLNKPAYNPVRCRDTVR